MDVLYESIDIHEYEQTRRLYPQWTGRRDKRGIPFYVYEINTLNPKEISAHDKGKDKRKQSTNTKTPWKMLKLFALYENMCRFVLPMCSAVPDRESPETPISQSNNIVDLSNVGFGKIWGLRNHMGDASNLANAHYPETLDRIFVIGAPSYFPTIWGWAKQWFDPITVVRGAACSSRISLILTRCSGQNFHSWSERGDVDVGKVCRPRECAQEVWRNARLEVWRYAQSRPSNHQEHEMERHS